MCFIDYNFFPILFFLGWNILTVKQLTPTVSHTSYRSPRVLPQPRENQGKAPSTESFSGSQFLTDLNFYTSHINKAKNPVEWMHFPVPYIAKKNLKNQKEYSEKSSISVLLSVPAKWKKTSRFFPVGSIPASEPRRYYPKDLLKNHDWVVSKSFKFDELTGFSSPPKNPVAFLFKINQKARWQISLLAFHPQSFKNSHSANWLAKSPVFSQPLGFSPVGENPNARFSQSKFGIDQSYQMGHFLEDSNLTLLPASKKRNQSFVFSLWGKTRITRAFRRGPAFGLDGYQKQRSKTRLHLRTPMQTIYSIHKFQIPLGFAKILRFEEINHSNRSVLKKIYSDFVNYYNPPPLVNADVSDHERPVSKTLSEFYSSNRINSSVKNVKNWSQNEKPAGEDSYHALEKTKLFLSSRQEGTEKFTHWPSTNGFKTSTFQVASNLKYGRLDRFLNSLPPSNQVNRFRATACPLFPKNETGSGLFDGQTAFDAWVYQNGEPEKRAHLVRDGEEQTNGFYRRLDDKALPEQRVNFQHRQFNVGTTKSLIIYGGSWYFENLMGEIIHQNRQNSPFAQYLPRSAKKSVQGQGIRSLVKQTGSEAGSNHGGGAEPALLSYYASRSLLSGIDKLETRKLESDANFYGLAHKLSSLGIHNNNSDNKIYPFKYNDSYRYNFKNMNLNDFPRDFSKAKKFLDFKNPVFSKIHAPLFQPQGLNLLSFIKQRITPSINSSRKTIECKDSASTIFSKVERPGALLANLPGQNQYFSNQDDIDGLSKLQLMDSLHEGLPINGLVRVGR